MNETFEKLCTKHSLTEKAKLEFKNLFEKEIIKVFNRTSLEISKESTSKESSKESVLSKIMSKTKTKTTTTNPTICLGTKADGQPCTFKAKENGYCGRHSPDKSVDKTAKTAKPRVKKTTECHAIIAKTGKNCIQSGTIKPDGSDFYYCKRHSEKWIDFEPPVEQDLVLSEAEEEPSEEVEGVEAEEPSEEVEADETTEEVEA